MQWLWFDVACGGINGTPGSGPANRIIFWYLAKTKENRDYLGQLSRRRDMPNYVKSGQKFRKSRRKIMYLQS